MQRLKPLLKRDTLKSMLDLHSTMQRLKPFCHARKFNIDCTFTFHYAKIKTAYGSTEAKLLEHLHSTMQRLKLQSG